ncbi:hypothetical protein D6829_01675 [Candidatus Pacearchaeota archaeon]|nr:MAG: hypothetical protein D6829_01675 [Candidatus Pacearchaeota archaeon]
MSSGYDWIARVSIFVIVISLAVIGVKLTGHATDTGTINLTVQSNVAINFTIDNINWSTGKVSAGKDHATLDTTGSGTVTNGTWAAQPGFRIENIGTVNVTLNISSDKDAATFLGDSGASFKYKISDNETGSCVGNGASSFTEFSGSNVDQPGCSLFEFNNSKDSIELDIELVIPYTTPSGAKSAVVTANATAV